MERRVSLHVPSKWRRMAALLAMLGLIFASTVASISHSLAMPLMGVAGVSTDHRHHASSNEPSDDHHHSNGHSHPNAEQVLADQGQNPDEGSCGEGCLLCKDCSLCSYLDMGQPQLCGPAHRDAFEAVRHTPFLDTFLPAAIEPPRV